MTYYVVTAHNLKVGRVKFTAPRGRIEKGSGPFFLQRAASAFIWRADTLFAAHPARMLDR
ncbi:hypothetical protein [Deinococcus frigens]|uniref:hypothetical protein n=1 Tax=Deinococcus frigens TaxID=249403 RepID=UPI0012EB6055|nr:hypothetical protein [Deinococcus frigens]